jgi:hypothetical protein
MSEGDVIEALEALRDADQSREAAPHVEAHLLEQYRGRRARRLWMRASASAAAAAVIVMAVAMYAHRPQRASEPPAVSITPTVVPAAPLADPAARLPQPKPARPKPVPVRRTAEVVPHEVYTDFFPLTDLAPPLERGELVRVIVPASTMRAAGMLVMASHLDDPVEADVLIGQDGLARAIRFVSYQ